MSADRKDRLKRTGVVAGLLAVGIPAAAVAGNAIVDTLNSSSAGQSAEKNVQKHTELLNGKVILSEGVKLRSEPQLANDTQSDVNGGNVVATVKPGQITVFDHPFLYTNQANVEFIGGLDKDGDYVWVASEKLVQEDLNSDKNYITYVMDENVGGEETHPGRYKDGKFYYKDAVDDAPVATITSLPAEMADEIYPDMK